MAGTKARAGKRRITDHQIRYAIMTRLTVPIWPHAGRALGVGRSAAFEGARTGDIETVEIGHRRPVPTSFLKRKLGLPEGEASR